MHCDSAICPHFSRSAPRAERMGTTSCPKAGHAAHPTPCAFIDRGQSSTALCIIVAWGGLLGAQAALALTWSDAALPGDQRLSNFIPNVAGVLVRAAKTGPMQVSLVEHAFFCRFLASATTTLANSDSRLFNFDYGIWSMLCATLVPTFASTPRALPRTAAGMRALSPLLSRERKQPTLPRVVLGRRCAPLPGISQTGAPPSCR